MPTNTTPRPAVMHINYCEQGQTALEACHKAARWGFDGIELRLRPRELPAAEYFSGLAAASREAGLRWVGFGGGVALDLPSAQEREASLQEFFHLLGLCLRQRQPDLINLTTDWLEDKSQPYDQYEAHGSKLLAPEAFARQVEGLQRIARFGEENGLRFALETHHCYPHDLPAAALGLLRAVDSKALGVTFDYGNLIGFDPPPALDGSIALLGDWLLHVHLKNSLSSGTRQRIRYSLSGGEINNRQLLRLLDDAGYQGALCIESPRPGDREHFAVEDLAYLRTLPAAGH